MLRRSPNRRFIGYADGIQLRSISRRGTTIPIRVCGVFDREAPRVSRPVVGQPVRRYAANVQELFRDDFEMPTHQRLNLAILVHFT
jgi:hypothetical protein